MSAEPVTADRPLSRLRILDFTAVMAGPFSTRLFADLGADVIKIEPPEGELIRGRTPVRDGKSAYFGQLNCGKRSLVLDLKSEEGQAIARRLASKCDIVVENFRPGVMKRLGLDYERLAADNPGVIYCSISGYGQTGPAAKRPAYAPIIHAASGYDSAHMIYQGDSIDRPARTGIFMADVLGGIYAFGAIQTALLHREWTGEGQMIDLSMMEAMLSMLVHEGLTAQFPPKRSRPLYCPLRTRDGFVIVAPVSQRNFDALAAAIGHPEWSTDPRFSTIDARAERWELVNELVEEWTSQRTSSECERHLSERGVPCSRYNTVGEALMDEQLVHRGALATIDDGAGLFKVPNPPFKMSRSNTDAKTSVADLGEDTTDILSELLGCTTEEIAQLRERGVVVQSGSERANAA